MHPWDYLGERATAFWREHAGPEIKYVVVRRDVHPDERRIDAGTLGYWVVRGGRLHELRRVTRQFHEAGKHGLVAEYTLTPDEVRTWWGLLWPTQQGLLPHETAVGGRTNG